MALKDTFFGTPLRTLLTLGGAAALAALIIKRRSVGKVAGELSESALEAAAVTGEAIMNIATSAQLAAVRALMPKGTEYIADLAFELAPKYDVSPYTILGITYAESDFGRTVTPQGPEGTGDRIARSPTRCVQVNAKGDCIKNLRQLVDEIGFPVTTNSAGNLVPSSRGWGHGLYQLDLMWHHPFIASGAWSDPRAAMEYALKLYTDNRRQIQKAVPGIGPVDLLRATIAAYNAGASAVIKALRAGVPASQLDQGATRAKGGTRVTYSAGYVDKILSKGNALTPQNVA